jgi:hypothetical protein
MNEQMKQQQESQFNNTQKATSAKPGKEDYIEFEEVK